jgi:inosine/xanthosine triphosphatase
MRVAVGSLNPVKQDATAQALDDAEITTVDVDSGVPEQPRGRAETIEGAENRAAAALAATDCEYGVGIEGGVAEVEGADGLYLVMWAAVTDGEQWGRGGGPTLRLPTQIADRIRAGEELGPVLDDHLDTEGIARNEGAVGVLTDGRSDRASALAAAVSAAAGRFVSDAY